MISIRNNNFLKRQKKSAGLLQDTIQIIEGRGWSQNVELEEVINQKLGVGASQEGNNWLQDLVHEFNNISVRHNVFTINNTAACVIEQEKGTREA